MKLINLFIINRNITYIVNKYFLILLFAASIFTVNAQQELKVMSFNIFLANNEHEWKENMWGNEWHRRKDAVVQGMLDYSPDILAIQEPMTPQYKDLQDTAVLKNYGSIAFKLQGEEASYAQLDPIFYKKDKFEPLDKGRFWFSETPDTVSRFPNEKWPMICTWGKFRIKTTGKIFYVFNNHMPDLPQAQLNSVLLLLQKVNEIAEDYPVLMTGDFNFNHNEDAMDFVTHTPRGFKDSNCEASKIGKNLTPDILTTGGWGPYTDRTEDEERCWGIMDHIFYTDPFKVESYAIDTTTYNGYGGIRRSPSDHRAIVAKLKFN
ncbi:MAG: endonuclease/exonuclease/phosphatase family protein [Bacteroidales bacterium]|nr:endonuclease/exonuclease/phosphatase family protein [Bacteroidales bacterium]